MIKFSFFTVLVLLGILQGLMLMFFLSRVKDRNKDANSFLMVFLALIVATMFGRILRDSKLFYSFPNFLALPDAIIFLYGPILYFYFQKLLSGYKLKRSHFILHATPALLFLISEIPLLFDPNHPIRIFWQKYTTIRFVVIEGSAIISNIVYLILNLFLLKKYIKVSNNHFSHRQYPRYILTILVFIGVCLLGWLFSYISWVTGNYNSLSIYGYRSVWFSLVFLTYVLAYYAMSQPELFKMKSDAVNYRKPLVENSELMILKSRLESLMKEEKLFLKPKLSLQDLATKLDVSTNVLSNVINSGFNQNFNDFVNDYRIQEFIQLVEGNKHEDFTILALAYDSGFNSKTTFNTFFKKRMNQTPNQFVKGNRIT
jgi:AraC-like DNA-binding protein